MVEVVDTAPLRTHVRLLGDILGKIIRDNAGEKLFNRVEDIRLSSKEAQDSDTWEALDQLLASLEEQEFLVIARAFSQFLNLANIADQQHTTSVQTAAHLTASATLQRTLRVLQTKAKDTDIQQAIADLHIDLVLTAHPTEITRRTLIHKHRALSDCLAALDSAALTDMTRQQTQRRIAELISQIWHTEDFRTQRPTPVDEARWGFAVIENSLWDAVPQFLRQVDFVCDTYSLALPDVDWCPIRISSWIGGDRDGNPNVTADVTREVLLLAQWQACELFIGDMTFLHEELSATTATDEFRALAAGAREPYRTVLKPLLIDLREQRQALEAALNRGAEPPEPMTPAALLEPLRACYQSLVACGLTEMARGALLDTLRRAHCFGPYLIQLDIRQESGRHRSVLRAITQMLEMGDYDEWSEAQRVGWLQHELSNPRPLIPWDSPFDAQDQEVLDTFSTIAATPEAALGSYVISMASTPSDVLAVQLLLKSTECSERMPVVPLFETLTDLDNAAPVIEALLDDPAYRARIDKTLMVMIGYSDSAKDAGMLAAGWAQYQAQEALLATCARYDVALTLFHGRGGTIGRGGAPAHQALLSQPPGSLAQGLRVTEQGEMIRTKLGMTPLAVNTLGQYASAILQANLLPPPEPTPSWRALMAQLSRESCDVYREWVREDPQFVPYFRQATPEQELASLPLGSRPARRKSDGGIESLRAIPWIFAWMQNRLMLPAWLGAGEALQRILAEDKLDTLREMVRDWPFFRARLSMLEMVFAKSDFTLSAHYDQLLVEPDLTVVGKRLREQLQKDIQTLLTILDSKELLAHDPWAQQSIGLRNIYTAPLNLLQAELLRRVRSEDGPETQQALMVTMAGIAAGMRNTG
ncbi:MAG: phosphoenolpyruvate carboxylase [Luminiphilus sp.]